MSARSIAAAGQPAAKPVTGLRRLRWLFMFVALLCIVALPLELGVVQVPAGTAATLHGLPVVGKLFPAGAVVAPTPLRPVAPAILSVSNSPRTALVGRTERFSVRIVGLPHARLTYVLRYANGREQRAFVHTDAQGFSSHVFPVLGAWQQEYRSVATISVRDASGRLHAFTRFAVQLP